MTSDKAQTMLRRGMAVIWTTPSGNERVMRFEEFIPAGTHPEREVDDLRETWSVDRVRLFGGEEFGYVHPTPADIRLPNTRLDFDRGFRHGTDGIKFFTGARCRDPQKYADGYKAGREFWRQEFGRYPQYGDTRFDRE